MTKVWIDDYYRPSDGNQYNTAFMRLQQSMTGTAADYAVTVYMRGGVYDFTQSLDIIRKVTIIGEDETAAPPVLSSPQNYNGTTLRWLVDCVGIVTHYPSDSNGVGTYGLGNNVDDYGNLTLMNVQMMGSGKDRGLQYHGLNAHAPFSLTNVGIYGFGGCGVKANASFQAVETRGNLNGSRCKDLNILNCGGIGFLVAGGDGNDCIFDKIYANNNASNWTPGLSGVNPSQIANVALLPNMFIDPATGEPSVGVPVLPFFDNSSAGGLWIMPYVEGVAVYQADIAAPTLVIKGAINLPNSGTIIGAAVDGTTIIRPSLSVAASGSDVQGYLGDNSVLDAVFAYEDNSSGGSKIRLHHNHFATPNEGMWEYIDANSATARIYSHTAAENKRDGRGRFFLPSGLRLQNRNNIDSYTFTHTLGGIPLEMQSVGQRFLISSMSFAAGAPVSVTTSTTHFLSSSQRIYINGVGTTSGTLPITNGAYYLIDVTGATTFTLSNTDGNSAALYSGSSGLVVAIRATGYSTGLPTTGAFAKGDRIFNAIPTVSGVVMWSCINSGTTGGTWAAISAGAGSSGGGDANPSYLVLAATASLSNERVFTAGTGLTSTDAGADSTYTVAINDSIVLTRTSSIVEQAFNPVAGMMFS